MKPLPILSSVLAVSLAIASPTFAHVGHGDEFQATGGVNRVAVNANTDALLGIKVNPIQPAADGSAAVLIPVTALVDDNGRPLVFVQYGNFYEPVEVRMGATRGMLIQITKGLSVGEKLVTQGSLSLYAESRKTQTVDAASSSEASSQTDRTHARADAEGIPHSHDAAGNLVRSEETGAQSSGFPMGMVTAIGGGAVLVVGAIAFLGSGKKKNGVSDK